MRITIGQLGAEPVDVTRRLNAEADIELSQERERDAFERVVDDLTLSISNRDGAMSELFLSKPAQTIWDVNVYDSVRRIFWGRIKSPITFDKRAKWTNIRVFSVDKMFWDLCKAQKIAKWLIPFPTEYMTLTEFLARELSVSDTGPLSQLGIKVYDIDPLFRNRPIRDSKETDNPEIGNAGRYSDLDPEMTKYDILKAVALYYNAEFYIDAETQAFCMRHRSSIVSDTEHDLDAVIHADSEIEVDDIDQVKYDYIQSFTSVPKPATPSILSWRLLDKTEQGGFGATVLRYLVTNVFGHGSLALESEHSDPTKTEVIVDLSGTGASRYKATVSVPLGPSSTAKRNIYRYLGSNNYRLVGTINDNTTTEFVDAMSQTEAAEKPRLTLAPVKGKIYYRYDEEKGSWDTPIQQVDGDDEPTGNFMRIMPDLRFVDPANENSLITNSIYHIYFFFGNENDLDTTASQWVDLFRTRRPLRCTVSGTHYKYGDSFVSTKKLPGKYTVKKAVNKFIKKVTELELVTV